MTDKHTDLDGYVEQVRYELTELANLSVWICRGRFDQAETTIKNAMLEAGLTHARCLIEFLLNKDNGSKNIIAKHLNNVWVRPSNKAALEAEYKRLCDRLSHMSKKRVRDPRQPEWNLPWLIHQILDGLEELGQTLKGKKRHEVAFKEIVAEVRELHREEWPGPFTAVSANTSSRNDVLVIISSTGPPPRH